MNTKRNEEINVQLTAYAKQDLELAKKQGSTIMVETKQGKVMIVSEPNNKFSIRKQESGEYSKLLTFGNREKVSNYIVNNLYEVVVC